MTPYRDAGKGSYIIDRRCGKLGRLKVASGTSDREEYAALNAMVTRLKRERRWDVLALVQQHQLTPLELYDAIHHGETHLLPSAEELRPLPRAVEQWLASADVSPRTRDDYTKRLTFPPGTKTLALPDLVAAARADAIRTGKRQTYNNLLTASRAFVRDAFGKDSKLWKLLPGELDVTHRPGNPQEPEQIRALAVRMPYPDALWALCLSGMRQGEYWGAWDVLSDRVTIQGEKGRRGEPLPRVVPLVYRLARPRVVYSTFYKALVRDSGGTLNVHDLRKTAQRWWEDAGVPDWRISLYAGHAKGRHELATIYRKPRDLTRLLIEDADRMRAWLGDPPKLGLRAVNA